MRKFSPFLEEFLTHSVTVMCTHKSLKSTIVFGRTSSKSACLILAVKHKAGNHEKHIKYVIRCRKNLVCLCMRQEVGC